MAEDPRRQRLIEQFVAQRASLRGYLRKLTRDAEDIEDLIQETFVRVCAMSVEGTLEVESPRALLYRIAHNLVIDRARQCATRATDTVGDFEPLNVLSPEAPPDEQADVRCRFESFCEAVDTLPPLCRRVFVLRKVYQLSHAEIAEVLGVSHSTIEKHVAKGLLRCRDRLRHQGMLDESEAGGRGEPPCRVRDAEG